MFARPGFKTRREWLRDASQGFGMLALSALAASDERVSGLAHCELGVGFGRRSARPGRVERVLGLSDFELGRAEVGWGWILEGIELSLRAAQRGLGTGDVGRGDIAGARLIELGLGVGDTGLRGGDLLRSGIALPGLGELGLRALEAGLGAFHAER